MRLMSSKLVNSAILSQLAYYCNWFAPCLQLLWTESSGQCKVSLVDEADNKPTCVSVTMGEFCCHCLILACSHVCYCWTHSCPGTYSRAEQTMAQSHTQPINLYWWAGATHKAQKLYACYHDIMSVVAKYNIQCLDVSIGHILVTSNLRSFADTVI